MSNQRVQLAFNVNNLEDAIAYYQKLFGAEVNKRKPGYANFALDQPPLKLVLIENSGANERLNHLGVEVFDPKDVESAAARLRNEGIAELEERGATCCYAAQNKVWSIDPQGAAWEWYVVLEDAETFDGTANSASAPQCC